MKFSCCCTQTYFLNSVAWDERWWKLPSGKGWPTILVYNFLLTSIFFMLLHVHIPLHCSVHCVLWSWPLTTMLCILTVNFFNLQHDSTATSNVGPAERLWTAQAYTVKLPPVVIVCRAPFSDLATKRFLGCWRGVAILREIVGCEVVVSFPFTKQRLEDCLLRWQDWLLMNFCFR